MKKLYILKIGGSVLTNKNIGKLYLHRQRITKIAQNIKTALNKDKNLNLIIVHGGGGPAHHLAHKYSLQNGINNNKARLHGALLVRLAIQKLNTAILSIFLENGLFVLPVHTSSTIIQNNKKIISFNITALSATIKNGYIPIVYGDMVFDTKLGLSVCSGDTITSYLAQYFETKKVLLATDVDGIFTKDPHKYSTTKLLNKTSISNIFSNNTIRLRNSHNTDVTGGLKGKISTFKKNTKNYSALKEIIIFNGTIPKNYTKVLLDEKFSSTHITI